MKVMRLRKELGLTQAELAERCQTTQQQIAKIESGVSDPKLSSLQHIAKALRCEVRDLFFTPEEFERLANQTIKARKIRGRSLLEISQYCYQDQLIPLFDSLWERTEIVNNRVKVRKNA
jgi:transcriptional regulator with XRE-family HTH domain